MTVSIDLVDGAEVQQTPQGLSVTRTAIVSGLTGSRERMIWDALNTPGIPQFGEPHPVVPGVFALRRSAVAIAGRKVRVTVSYETPQATDLPPGDGEAEEQAELSVGSSVQETTTQKDKDGQPLTITLMTTEPDETGTLREVTRTRLGEAAIQIPQTVLRFTRRERGAPTAKSIRYVGTVNRDPIWGAERRTWLCLRIEGDSDDGGRTYRVTYEFQYRPETWDTTLVFIDEETGAPHADVDISSGNGAGTFRIYPERDFSGLNLAL